MNCDACVSMIHESGRGGLFFRVTREGNHCVKGPFPARTRQLGKCKSVNNRRSCTRVKHDHMDHVFVAGNHYNSKIVFSPSSFHIITVQKTMQCFTKIRTRMPKISSASAYAPYLTSQCTPDTSSEKAGPTAFFSPLASIPSSHPYQPHPFHSQPESSHPE